MRVCLSPTGWRNLKLRAVGVAAVATCATIGLTLTSAAAGGRAARSNIAIRDAGSEVTFTGKATLALDAAPFDSGRSHITPHVADSTVRDGQAQIPVGGTDVIAGKKGTLRILFQGTAIQVTENKYAEYGTWKLEQINAAGVYKGWTGGGRWASVEVGNHYDVEFDGLVRR